MLTRAIKSTRRSAIENFGDVFAGRTFKTWTLDELASAAERGMKGRNFDEVLRVIDSLQLTAKFKVATPANWTDGKDVIIGAAVTDEEAKTLFPGGWKTIKPYLRTLAQPK